MLWVVLTYINNTHNTNRNSTKSLKAHLEQIKDVITESNTP